MKKVHVMSANESLTKQAGGDGGREPKLHRCQKLGGGTRVQSTLLCFVCPFLFVCYIIVSSLLCFFKSLQYFGFWKNLTFIVKVFFVKERDFVI